MLSEEEARERMEDADDNGDGIVTWEEYIADAYGMEGNEDANFIDSENAQVKDFIKFTLSFIICIFVAVNSR